MNSVNENMSLLGMPVIDKVTGFAGVVQSVSFDLFGCIQLSVAPPMKDGKVEPGLWLDSCRCTITGERVMSPPDFFKTTKQDRVDTSQSGCAQKAHKL